VAATGDVRGLARPRLRFLGGLGFGLALFIVALVGLTIATDIQKAREAPRQAGLDTAFGGSDADHRGARAMVVVSSDGVVHQTCRGACDDLRINGANASSLRLLDAQGHNLGSTRRSFLGWTGDLAPPVVSRRPS
jgi:hypothetical protein